ncbi:siroheme synthase CysG [Entomobacter blattae]|uniref:Siroheme synthase n=1 Tax=Entomobacter blattae TaxID=2762277 RepID=A0A7H1NPQ2_9PROT|nr:siroheme synthase CysG [Entomobacter blattae]QNT77762.1 Siroheme synthase [Entomobacter blattae]
MTQDGSEQPFPGYLPIGLRLDGEKVLVIGGGGIAANKVRLLLSCRAVITVIAETLYPEMHSLHKEGAFTYIPQTLTEDSLVALASSDYRLAFIATNNTALNHKVSAALRAAHVLVCIVDNPEHSNFITPAIVDRGVVKVGIITSGAAPVLSRRIREKLEGELPSGTKTLAEFMGKQRHFMRQHCPDLTKRRKIWEAFIDSPGAEAARQGKEKEARAYLEHLLANTAFTGEVWLVGAGPGNADLLTLKALHLMQNADSVLYDQLLSPTILDRVRRDAERVFVGKKRNHHTMSQNEIQAEMIRRARRGERVLRLKGGDPLIFGRGGEEADALLQAGIPFQIVPGITAANGCAAYAGFALTHRDYAQSCLFLTGHAKADGSLDLPWKTLLHPLQTVVIYMGLSELPELCQQLKAHGMPADWPAAIVERGTLAEQKVVLGTLQTLPARAMKDNIQSPALIILGQTVKHRVIQP